MGNKRDWETRTILIKLCMFVPAFYTIYYIASIILVGGYGVGWAQLGRYPFRIDKWNFAPGRDSAATGAWLAMVVTYATSLVLTYRVVHATRRAWDYVFTVSILHFVICCIVNQAFPTNWAWWATLLIASSLLSLASEVMNYYLVDMREIQTDSKR